MHKDINLSLNSFICMLLFQIYSSFIIIRVRIFQSVMHIYLYLFLFLSHHQKYLSDSQKLLPLCRTEQNDWLFAFTQWSEKKRTEEKRGKRASYAHRECFDSKRVLVSFEWAKNLCPHLFLQLRLQNQCTVRRLEATTRVRTPRSCLRPLFLRWCRCPAMCAKTSGKTRLHRIEHKNRIVFHIFVS